MRIRRYKLVTKDIKLPILLIAGSELVYGCVMYGCLYMLRGDFTFFGYLYRIILPELVYTILITFILYQIILKINKKLEAEEAEKNKVTTEGLLQEIRDLLKNR